jgi:hypothetical protein
MHAIIFRSKSVVLVFLIKTIEPDVEQDKRLDPAHLFEPVEHRDNVDH